jgi:hypothetical protein
MFWRLLKAEEIAALTERTNRKMRRVLFPLLLALVIGVMPVFGADFVIKRAAIVLDGVKDADIESKTTVFPLTEGGVPDGGAYVAYVSYDSGNIYFACDAEDDVIITSDTAEADFRDSDYIRFYIGTQEDFEGVTTMGVNHYAFVWTPKPQVREVSMTSYGGIGHAELDGDLADEFVSSASGATATGWYVEAAIPWTVIGLPAGTDLTNKVIGIMIISGDTDEDNSPNSVVQEREGEARLASDATGAGGYWSSPDHFRTATFAMADVVTAVSPDAKLTTTWGGLKE